jgi:3-oxoacyl-[acyl-carrier-protein] synthase-3
MVRSGAINTAVLIGVERMSWVVDYTDRGTCILFGDGAGAVVIQASEEETGIVSSHLGVDGTMADILCVPNDGTIQPGSATSDTKIQMSGSDVFRRAVTEMADASEKVVKEAGWGLDEIDLLIPHQANQRIIDATARRLKLDSNKVFLNVHAYGNTSAASIPIALTEALEAGLVSPNANLVFASFGGGLTWAAAAVKFGSRVEPISTIDDELPPNDKTVWELLQPNFDYYGRLEHA